MNIGIPKEILIQEKRVALTPQGVYSLVKEGHSVYIEKGAGEDGRFSDETYREVGGEIVFSHEEAFRRADLVVKVMPPTEEECQLLHPETMIISFLQLGMRTRSELETLLSKKITAIGTELIETRPGHKPVLVAMSEIAGNMLPQITGRFLECQHGGRGISIGGVAGIPPSTIVILGAGVVGTNATKAFLGLGAQVLIADCDLERLRYIDYLYDKRAITTVATHYAIEKALRFADALIGAVFVPGERPPILVSRDMIKEMKKGAVIVDVSIDQGGCIETSRPTTHSDPVFMKDEIVHYCVPNIPAAVARTASHALNNVALPFVTKIANSGFKEVLRKDEALRKGVFLHNGKCTHKRIAQIFDLEYKKL